MNIWIFLVILMSYFIMLIGISHLTSDKKDSSSWFNANKSAPWPVVAYGMVGTSLSGVTFLSIPGWVAISNFSYMQTVLGYLMGYALISLWLLPTYYKKNVTSIYQYLGDRFGPITHKTGAVFFLISRTVGAGFRLYLVAIVFQILTQSFGLKAIPFWLIVSITILLIFLYTFRGGIKTVIWTDLVQTTFMLMAGLAAFLWLAKTLNLTIPSLITQIHNDPISNWWVTDWSAGNHFLKNIASGAFIALCMTGLDQDMMQKNLTCHNLKASQKNIALFCVILVIVNFGFLSLGGALYQYGEKSGVVEIHKDNLENPISIKNPESGEFEPTITDKLFARLALDYSPDYIGVVFILGLIAAAYSSADSALTGLTTSFCIDFLRMDKKKTNNSSTRLLVQSVIAIVLLGVILIFKEISEPAVISSIFKAAGYTYGPLLGFFAFGFLFPEKMKPDYVSPLAAIVAILATAFISSSYHKEVGFLILPINGFFTLIFLFLFHSARSALEKKK